jgi:hypothetical protein
MTDIEEVLIRLSRVREVSTRCWLAQCPVKVHDEMPATLLVTLVESGGFVFRCGLGCEQSEVRRALGIVSLREKL